MNHVRAILKSLNCDGRMGLALLCTCLALVAPELAGDAGRLALRYERAGIAAGQWWRLISAHLVHLGPRHAIVNALGLALMWALFARDYTPRQWLVIVAGAMLAIDAGLWTWDSTIQWYVGSSGVLHGVMAAGTLAHLKRREADGWILLGFLAGKLAYEQLSGPLPFSGTTEVVVDAHLFGVAGGLAVALCLRLPPLPLYSRAPQGRS